MSAFILPSAPVLRDAPPSGPGWLHEIKFDGFRLQAHKAAKAVTLYTRNGADYTDRFPAIRNAVAALRCCSAVIDLEGVACDERDRPDFRALIERTVSKDLCGWAFDLLEVNGRDIRPLPLRERRKRLQALLSKPQGRALRLSEDFPDAVTLLEAAARHKLEGIVSKKADQPYRSGRNPGWIKVKTAAWREANAWRREAFQR